MGGQVLRRCLHQPNPREELRITVLQDRMTDEDTDLLLRILRGNLAQIQFLLRVATRADGATFNAEELAISFIAAAELDLTLLYRLQKQSRTTSAA